MARAATKGGKRPQPHARPTGAAPAAPRKRRLSEAEQGLFFTRIRSHAKWMFVLLAVVFAGGFIFFGVGSGSNGGGSLSDLFNNLFHGGSSGPSISKAEKALAKNPRNATAWKDLATAYESKGQSDQAISAWESYTSLRPKDIAGLTQLAGLASNRANDLRNQAITAQYTVQNAYGGPVFGALSNTTIGHAVGVDPFQSALQSDATQQTSLISQQLQGAYQTAVTTFQKLGKLEPTDANVQLGLAQAAQAAGQTAVAVAAYNKVAKLLPSRAADIHKLVKQLQPTVVKPKQSKP
jgi:Flp pilus assembly protein TadD